MDDPRFSKLFTDPKYRNVPRKERKVKIDERFQSLFKDKKFVSKVNVDKRGRPGNFSTKENYEKFYELESSDSDDDSEEEKKELKLKEKKKKKKSEKPNLEENNIKNSINDSKIDYARGEGLISDSSSGEEESDEDDQDTHEVDDGFDKWGELDHDADTTEEATNRLAVCNMVNFKSKNWLLKKNRFLKSCIHVLTYVVPDRNIFLTYSH